LAYCPPLSRGKSHSKYGVWRPSEIADAISALDSRAGGRYRYAAFYGEMRWTGPGRTWRLEWRPRRRARRPSAPRRLSRRWDRRVRCPNQTSSGLAIPEIAGPLLFRARDCR